MHTVKIKGMSCQHCVAAVSKALAALPGVSGITVNLEKGEAQFSGEVDQATLRKAIEGIGFEMPAA